MAFGLAACHQPRGACAVPGLAERGSARMLARTSAAFPRLRRVPAVGSTRLAPPGSPLSRSQRGNRLSVNIRAHEIPSKLGAVLGEEPGRACQPRTLEQLCPSKFSELYGAQGSLRT